MTSLATSNQIDDIVTVHEQTQDVCFLKKPESSLFVGNTFREHPEFEIIYGFLHHKMGIKLRKHVAKTYPDEMTHYKNYIKNTTRFEDYKFIVTRYELNRGGWGRVNPDRSLSLSLFHRPSRHSFAAKNYIDFDMVNCQIQLIYCIAKKIGNINTYGLAKYCADSKKARLEIAEFYGLTDLKDADGLIVTPKEQAKKLPIRLAFGGGIRQWKIDYNVEREDDMRMIESIRTSIQAVSNHVLKANPHILADLKENIEGFDKKEDYEQRSSVLAYYAQTWERIMQEECVATCVRLCKNVQLPDIIPSQDGFMVLKSQMKGVNIPQLLETFSNVILAKFEIEMKWDMKAFDEAIDIPRMDTAPLYINLHDLEKGERHIADLIGDVLYDSMKYIEKNDCWYVFNTSSKLWERKAQPDIYTIIKTIQDSVEEEKYKYWSMSKAEADEDKKKKILKKEAEATKYYQNVGKAAFSNQVARLLKTILCDDRFPNRLDKTAGKLVFRDGIYDLKKDAFNEGFKKTDYVTYTLSHKYKDVKPTDEKMQYLRGKLTEVTNNNESHLEYYLGVVGHAMTGDAQLEKAIYYIVDGTENKKGDNGKTFILGLLGSIFPELVRITDPKVLEADYAKAHKQIATWKGMRLVYADEGTKKKLNASLIKKIGDGCNIENEIMFGTVEVIDVMFKMFICSNHLPKIDKEEEAVYNRYKQIQMCSHFDRTGKRKEADPEALEFIADRKLPETLVRDYSSEIIAMIVHYAVKYYREGLPPVPDMFEKAVQQTRIANNDFATRFYKYFEDGEDADRVSLDDIHDKMSMPSDLLKKELKDLGFKYNKELKGFGKKINNDGIEVYIKGGYTRLKERICEDDDEN